MKFKLALAVAGLLVAALGSALVADGPALKVNPFLTPRPQDTANYQKTHESFVARTKEGPIGVMFLGDSITAGWVGNGRNLWKKTFEPMQAVNFGIGSDRIENVLWRVTNGELDGAAPKVIVLLIGTNNIGGDPAMIAEGIAHLIDVIRQKQPKVKMILMGVFPRGKSTDTPKMIGNVKEVNAKIGKLDDGKNLRFVDLGETFAPGGKFDASFFSDGVHLTEKGYQVWTDAITPFLKTMME